MAANFLQQLPKLPNLGKFHVPSKLSGLYRPKKAVPEHQAMVQRQASMSLIAPHGLQNLTGENNCFLNSAIQVLWHIDVFRRSFRELEGHTCVGNSCIFCALKDLFTQFQHSSQTTIPPDVLRHALAECYREKHRFQLNLMDDAAECFEKLLEQIHFHLTGDDDLDSCGAPYCISHQCFALNILERTECVCGATSEPLSFVQFVHYISSSALVKEAQKYIGRHVVHTDESTPTDTPTTAESGMTSRNSSVFGKILHAASSYGEYRECPNFAHCKKNVAVKRILLNCPDIVCLGLIWDSDQPPVSDIMAVVNNIGLTLQLGDVFDTVSAENAHYNQYQLTATIAYYGRHYSTFCLHSRKREWIYFDDGNFRTIGEEWSDVCEEIRKAHYQPLLLVYSNQFADKIDVSQAPTVISRTYPQVRKPAPSIVSTITEKGDVVNNKDTVTPAEGHDKDELKTQDKPKTDSVKLPSETIDPMTFSIIPSKIGQLAHAGNKDKCTPQAKDSKPAAGVSQFNPDNNLTSTPIASSQAASVSSSEPVNDLMTFSIMPTSIARMTNSSSHLVAATPPTTKHELPVVENPKDDLIKFSISPSLLGNAHNSRLEYLSGNNGGRNRQEDVSGPQPQAGKPNQTPELHQATKSPQISRNMMTGEKMPAPIIDNTDQYASSNTTTGNAQAIPPIQRQTSFPFQNKLPAPVQGGGLNTDVHAVPQGSDFASRFRGYTTVEGDVLRPDWEHFAKDSGTKIKEDSSRLLSTSPEAWTVLNVAGDEEATFSTRRPHPKATQCHDPNTEDIKYTPAITSLKRVASSGQDQMHSMANRPLPSIPHSSSDTAVSARQSHTPSFAGRTVVSTTTGSSASGNASLHGYSGNSVRAGSSNKSSSHHDLNYVDPDDLVFSKPQHHSSLVQRLPNEATRSENEVGRKGKNNSIPLVTLSQESTSTKEGTPPPVRNGEGKIRDVSSASHKLKSEADFSSPPITADPLYALPEKLKLKFAPHTTNGQSVSGVVSEDPTTTSEVSSTPLLATTSGNSSSAKPITGADYLSLLLQERQTARQVTTDNSVTPAGILLDASTKVKSNSDHLQTSLTATTCNSLSDKPRPASGKEYLEELLQKKQQSKSAQLSAVRSPGQAIGADPLYAVPDKQHLTRKAPETVKINVNTTQPALATQASSHSSVPIGGDPLYAVPDKSHKGNNQKVNKPITKENLSTKVSPNLISQSYGGGSGAVIPAIPEGIHSSLLEARDLWAKAEASLDSDKTVAYMLFTQHNSIVAQVLRDATVRTNIPLLNYVSNIKKQGTKRAQDIKASIESSSSLMSRPAQAACQRCGSVRNLDSNKLCGPCKLRVQIGK